MMPDPYIAVSRERFSLTARGLSGAAQQGTATPDGFTGANTEDLAFEIAQKIVDLQRDVALAGQYVPITQFEDEITSKPDPNDPSTWDWTPAIAAGIQYMKDNAQSATLLSDGVTTRYDNLPTLYFPGGSEGGIYNNYTTTHNLHYMRGWKMVADEGVEIRHHGASYLFDVLRCKKWNMVGFTAWGYDPNATGNIKGLMQNSGFMRLHEHSSETLGSNTLEYTFHGVTAREFHRAFRFDGNQMLDGAMWVGCKMHDNFIDFDYHNGQAVNQKVYGGENYYGVTYPIADYEARLSAWTGTPWTGRATWHPYDGAVVWVKAGGQLSTFGHHFVSNKARFHVDEILSTDDVGTTVNTLGYYDYDCRYEMRKKDPAPVTLKGVDQDRITMIRYTNPSPPDAGGTTRARLGFAFDRCSWNMQDGATTPIRLFHIANAIQVRVTCVGARAIIEPARANIALCVNNATQTDPGSLIGEMPILTVQRNTTSDYTLGAGGIFVNHLVDIETSGSRSYTAQTESRTLPAARMSGKSRVKTVQSPYGLLPGTGGISGTEVVKLGPNALLKRIVAARQGSGDTTTLQFTITYTNVYGTAVSKTLNLAQSGSVPMVGVLNLDDYVSNGEVTITTSTGTATAVYGNLELEYC